MPEAPRSAGCSVCSDTMRYISDDRGQSMVELALMLPLLVFVLIGGADLARAYGAQIAVQNAARAGAEAAAISQSPTAPLAIARARDELSRTPGVIPASAVISAKFTKADGVTSCVAPTSVANPCFATLRVRYTWRTITAWPLIPNVARFDRSTTMRMIVAAACDGIDLDGNDGGDDDGDDPNECDDD